MKTIVEYLINNHVNKDSNYIIEQPIREYVKKNWNWETKKASDELTTGLPIQDIFDVKEKSYTIYCEHESVYLHIKSSEEQYGANIIAVFTKDKENPTDKEYASFESSNYQYNTRQMTNHLANFWQMLNYAISNSNLNELKK